MTLAVAVAAAMFVGVIAYALFGGADFGSGFYDLTAGGGRRVRELRTLVDHSIGPVWEANHVWLIYVLVIWWTGFPAAFAAAMTTLFVPLMLALAGIVLRGASFAFRKYAATFGQARLFGAIFAGSSLITPFFLGTVAGAIASGRVPAAGYGDRVGSWINPTSMVGGCLAVATCVFLAGVFLTADAARAGGPDLAERLRTRTLVVGIVTGVIVFAGYIPSQRRADPQPRVAQSCLAASGGGGARRGRPPSCCSIAEVIPSQGFRPPLPGRVITGWGMGQYPWMLVDQVTINDAAGADATLAGLLVVVALAVVSCCQRWAICCGSPRPRNGPNLSALVRSMPRRYTNDPSAVHADDGLR